MKKTMLKTVFLGALAGTAGVAYAAQDMGAVLPHAKAGECYARVVIPAEYRTESSTVVVKEASEQVKIIPAKYEWAEERVLVSEAASELRVIPATFGSESQTYEVSPASTSWVVGSAGSSVQANPGLLQIAREGGASLDSARPGQCFHEHYQEARYDTVTERVLVSEASEQIKLVPARYEWVEQRVMVAPAGRKLVEVPAVFETVQERVLVESAKTVWKKGRGGIEKIDNATGDIMCLVEIPAVYKTLSKRVLKAPASTRAVEEPARYETIRVRKLVDDAREVRTAVPAKYKDVTKRVKVSEPKHLWHEVETQGDFGKKTGNVICLKETPARTASVSRKVVKTPASVQRVEIPAKYETKRVRRLVSDAREERTTIPAQTRQVSKRIKVSDSRLEWRSILCETNMSTSTIRGVQRALLSAGYAPGPIDGVLGRETMNAIDRYQRARGMATGGLTMETLEKLGVNPRG